MTILRDSIIDEVTVSVLVSSASLVDSNPGLIKPNTITLACVASLLSTHHYGIIAKTFLARNHDNVSAWSDMPTHGLLSQ
jgi:hypothetical protein